MRRILIVTFCAAITVAALAPPARAADVLFTGSQGTLSASAEFITGQQLVVILTNTGSPAAVPADVLTNLLFTCSGCGTLTGVSALTSGPTFQNGLQVSPTNSPVGGEWALVTGANGSFQIASSGANGAGASDPLFPPGTNLDGPAAPAGFNYGIVSSISANANQGLTSNPITTDDVHFTLNCSAVGGCANATFSNVVFQYGTSPNEPSFGGGTGSGSASGQNVVPEPTSLLLFGSGLAATAYRARRKKTEKDS